MKFQSLLFVALSAGMLLFASCEKEDDVIQPDAMFTASKTTVVVDEEIQFTNTSDNATAFKWSFGDGTTSTEVSPKKSWQSSAKFLVSLVSTGAGGSQISSMEITVLPLGGFIVQNEDSLTTGVPVQFTNSSKGATSYEWSFGDSNNSTSSDTDPVFTYTAPGDYTVTLKSRSAVGETTTTKTITVTGAADVKELYYVEYGAGLLQRLPLNGASPVTFLDITGKGGVGLAYDEEAGIIFFSDFEVTPEGKIWRMNADGSGLEAIVTGLVDPYGIALHEAAGKIYWTDDAGNISRANYDGSSLETGIVNIPDGQMRAIALDPENNKMYFYEVNQEILYVADLDGSNVTPLLTGIYGYAILVDTVNDHLFFEDQNSETLIRTNLDGSGSITIDNNGTRIYGMAIDHEENKLYWSGRDSGEIKRSNLDGTNPEVIIADLDSPRGIFLKQ